MKKEAIDIFRKITAGSQWASFGYIAAEAELGRVDLTPRSEYFRHDKGKLSARFRGRYAAKPGFSIDSRIDQRTLCSLSSF
jgi:hypothetical protein